MTIFDFMSFGYSVGDNDMFVANAKRYTAEDVVEICKREYEHLFKDHDTWGHLTKALREPDIADVQQCHCAYRFGNPEYPEGCYTLVGEGERGAFPVYVISFDQLKDLDN